MTDDANLTPGGELNAMSFSIAMKTDSSGHLVEWEKNGVTGKLGPFVDREIAERAMEAKRLELAVNDKPL